MVRNTVFICILSLMLASCTQFDVKLQYESVSKDPFSTFDFDKVIAYDFRGDTDVRLLDTSGVLTNVITKEVVLDSVQLDEFKKIIMDSTTFGEVERPTCFFPHCGIAFYKKVKIIQHVEVSLICLGLLATFPIPELDKRGEFEKGITEKGRERIYYFCKKLGFKNYLGSKKYIEYQPQK